MTGLTDHNGFLEFASRRMLRYARSEKFIEWVCHYLHIHLKPTQVSAAMYDDTSGTFCIQISKGRNRIPPRLVRFDPESPLMRWFMTERSGKTRRSHRLITSERLKYATAQEARKILKELCLHRVEVCVKIETHDRLAGYLLIGPREDSAAYDHEDITFFHILANDIGIEIEKEEYRAFSASDHLTGMLNRTTLDTRAENLLQKCHEEGLSCAAAMIDIDNFKSINDRYGHPAGDLVIRTTAELIRSGIRKTDLAFRYGGEEFLLLFKMTSRDPARCITPAEFQKAIRQILGRVCRKVAGHPLSCSNHTISVSISVGVAFYHGGSAEIQDLIRRADEALYAAKSRGKNKVVSEEDVKAQGQAA